MNRRYIAALILVSAAFVTTAHASYYDREFNKGGWQKCQAQINEILHPTISYAVIRTSAEAKHMYLLASLVNECLEKWNVKESKRGLIKTVKKRVRALMRADSDEWVDVLQSPTFVSEKELRRYIRALQEQNNRLEDTKDELENRQRVILEIADLEIIRDGDQEAVIHKDGL